MKQYVIGVCNVYSNMFMKQYVLEYINIRILFQSHRQSIKQTNNNNNDSILLI